jgi:DNA-binding PadR family transcriptional regulator
MYAVRDGLIHWVMEVDAPGGGFTGAYKHAYYEITPEGREFIRKWLSDYEETSIARHEYHHLILSGYL